MTSKVGQKLAASAFAPLISFAIGTAGYTVADEMLASTTDEYLAANASRIVAAVPAVVEDANIIYDDALMIVGNRLLYNSAEGIEVTGEVFAEQCMDDAVAFFSEGETVWMSETSAGLFDNIWESIATGLMSVDCVPLFANAGAQMLEWAGVTPSLYDDANVKYVNSEGPLESGDLVTVSDDYDPYGFGYQTTWNKRQTVKSGVYDSNTVMYVFVHDEPIPSVYDKGFIQIFKGNLNTGEFMLINNQAGDVGGFWFRRGVSLEVHAYDDTLVYTDISEVEEYVGWEQRLSGAVVGPAVPMDVFESGNVLIGNDAEFDGGGNLVDPGTVDVAKVLESEKPYSSWAETLDAGDVVAVKPADPDNVKATDEVAKPKVKDPETGEYKADPSKEKVGDAVRGDGKTATRISAALDLKIADLGDAVSGKFPFCVPADMSAVVRKFEARSEAPRFTWVFDVPTGREEVVVDLSGFEPVAGVLRAMLNVSLLFGCLALLSKVANLFALIGGE